MCGTRSSLSFWNNGLDSATVSQRLQNHDFHRRSRLFVFSVINDFLAVMERGSEVGFPVFNELLRTLVGVLDLAFELLGFFGKELARFLAGLRCIQQGDASAEEDTDDEDGETTAGNGFFLHILTPLVA